MTSESEVAGDAYLAALLDEYSSRGGLLSPGGAAALLGVKRQTIDVLIKRGKLRAYRSNDEDRAGPASFGPRWVLIPVEDVRAYAEHVGRRVSHRHSV